ncbi:ATP-binding protein [Thermosulfuriphilus sp.]
MIKKGFGLGPEEEKVLLIALGAEIGEQEIVSSLKAEKLLWPTPGFTRKLLKLSPQKMRELFAPEGLLRSLYLIKFLDPFPEEPFWRRPYRLADGLLDRLLGLEPSAERFQGLVEEISPPECQHLSPEAKEIARLGILAKQQRRPLWIQLSGPRISREVVLEEALFLLGLSGWRINLDLWGSEEKGLDSLATVIREALLSGRVLILEGQWPENKARAGSVVERLGWLVFSLGPEPKRLSSRWIKAFWHLDPLKASYGQQIWQEVLGENKARGLPLVSRREAWGVMGQFSGPQRLHRPLWIENLLLGRAENGYQRLTRIIHPRRSLDDLILPEEEFFKLRLLVSFVREASILENWGLNRIIWPRLGINVLFRGPSGTGKTLAAEALAQELGRLLLKIDLSVVVSKWVGETEKRLSHVFDCLTSSEVVVFFDEADSLFGRRTELKDSRDRYANLEINHLLQKMEEHQGLVILASNLTANLDEAFLRRIDIVINFPFPDEAARLRLWRKLIPQEMPLKEEIDVCQLARRFRLTGGQIRNAVLTAAFLGASKGCVSKEDLLQAIELEYQKLGTSTLESTLGS